MGFLSPNTPLLLVVLLLLQPAGHLTGQEPPGAASPSPDLRSLLAPGFLVEDRNDDGHPDFVNARILLPVDADGAEVAAAGNLAARLAFESYATDLGLLRLDSPEAGQEEVPLLVVGRAHALLAAVGMDHAEVLRELVAGEGMVLRLPPSSALPAGGVWVAGADATGLLAAAEYVSGRYPGVWAPEGPTWEALAEGIRSHLLGAEDDETPEDDGPVVVTLERAVVSATRPGISRTAVTVQVTDPDRWEAAREALDPAAAGRVVLVPGLHRLDLRLRGPAGEDSRLRIAPERPWEEGELSAWQPRELSDFTLSDLFTLRGIYRDSSQDLLPDRTEAWISLRGTEAAGGVVDLAMRVAHEATGVRFPLVRLAGEDDPPEALGFPILFGVDHFTTARLREEERLGAPSAPTLPPGEGFVELVEKAIGDRHALVVGGSDEAGLAAAARLVSHRFPFLHG